MATRVTDIPLEYFPKLQFGNGPVINGCFFYSTSCSDCHRYFADVFPAFLRAFAAQRSRFALSFVEVTVRTRAGPSVALTAEKLSYGRSGYRALTMRMLDMGARGEARFRQASDVAAVAAQLGLSRQPGFDTALAAAYADAISSAAMEFGIAETPSLLAPISHAGRVIVAPTVQQVQEAVGL